MRQGVSRDGSMRQDVSRGGSMRQGVSSNGSMRQDVSRGGSMRQDGGIWCWGGVHLNPVPALTVRRRRNYNRIVETMWMSSTL